MNGVHLRLPHRFGSFEPLHRHSGDPCFHRKRLLRHPEKGSRGTAVSREECILSHASVHRH